MPFMSYYYCVISCECKWGQVQVESRTSQGLYGIFLGYSVSVEIENHLRIQVAALLFKLVIKNLLILKVHSFKPISIRESVDDKAGGSGCQLAAGIGVKMRQLQPKGGHSK